MGLPSKRRTKTSKKERASHFALKPRDLAKCSQCGKPVLPHHACGACGNYKGRTAVKIKIKSKAKAKTKKK
ncbi:MAG: 50S ribosomal protein L32 [Candidatus Buchananbacteria bacterium]